MASIPSSFSLPPDAWDFIPEADGIGLPVSPTPGAVYYFSRWFYIEEESLYFLRVWSQGASTQVQAGPSLVDLQTISTPASESPVETQILLPAGLVRITVSMEMPSDEGFGMMLYRPGKPPYLSTIAGWVYDEDTLTEDEDITAPIIPPPLVFSILPDWSEPITEQIIYKSEVNPSETAYEGKRRYMRLHPRRTFEARFLRQRDHRRRLDLFLASVRRSKFLLPLWHEQYWVPGGLALGQTTVEFPDYSSAVREFFVGDYVMVIANDPGDYELLQVSEMDHDNSVMTFAVGPVKDWPQGVRIFPCRMARLLDRPELSGPTDEVAFGMLRFDLVETDYMFSSNWSDFGNMETFWFPFNRAEDMSFVYDANTYTYDPEVGPREIVAPGERVLFSIRGAVSLHSRYDTEAFRKFIDGAAGRTFAFWANPAMSDLAIVDEELTGNNFLVKQCGLSDYFPTPNSVRAMVEFVFRQGGTSSRYTIQNVEKEGEYDRVYVNGSLLGMLKADILRAQFVMPSRFDQDVFELAHHVDESAIVTTSVVIRSTDQPVDGGIG